MFSSSDNSIAIDEWKPSKQEQKLVVLRWQAKIWLPWGCRSKPWMFYKANVDELVVFHKPHVLQCILCHVNYLSLGVLVAKTKGRKGLITYITLHGTTSTTKKHVQIEYFEILNRYFREVSHRSRNWMNNINILYMSLSLWLSKGFTLLAP